MRNLLLEKDVAQLLDLAEGEQAVATCCGVLEQPCLYIITNLADILCLGTGNDSPQVRLHAALSKLNIPQPTPTWHVV